MALTLGRSGKAYHNTGTYGVPVWDEVPNLTNLTLTMEKSSADVTSRASGGWRERKGTLREGTVEAEMIYDTADADFTAIQTAYLNDTGIELAIMDGDITTTGNQGLRATFDVGKFSRSEQLEDAMRVPVEFWITHSANAAAWYTVP